jgi:hypothetical protein
MLIELFCELSLKHKKRRINESSKERSKGRYENNTFQMPSRYMLIPQGSIQFTHSPIPERRRGIRKIVRIIV